MWIRSQDRKTLRDCSEITFFEYDGIKNFMFLDDSKNTLGEYSTEEKAIEVLNMISKQIGLIEAIKVVGVKKVNKKYNYTINFPFEMPLDEEVETA